MRAKFTDGLNLFSFSMKLNFLAPTHNYEKMEFSNDETLKRVLEDTGDHTIDETPCKIVKTVDDEVIIYENIDSTRKCKGSP